MTGVQTCALPICESVAQSVEHRPFKARALGSSPSRLTTLGVDLIARSLNGNVVKVVLLISIQYVRFPLPFSL